MLKKIKTLYNQGKYDAVIELTEKNKGIINDEALYAATAASLKLNKHENAAKYILKIKNPHSSTLKKLPDIFLSVLSGADIVIKRKLIHLIPSLIKGRKDLVSSVLIVINDVSFDKQDELNLLNVVQSFAKNISFWEECVAMLSQKSLATALFNAILRLPDICVDRVKLINAIFSKRMTDATTLLSKMIADKRNEDLSLQYFSVFSKQDPNELINSYKKLYSEQWAPVLDNAEVVNCVALACRAIGEMGAAKKLIDAAAEITTNQNILSNQALIHGDAGEISSAIKLFEGLLTTTRSIENLNNFGNLLVKSGMYARAETILLEISEKNPDLIFPRTNLGNLYANTGQFSKVYETYRNVPARKVGLTVPLFASNYDISISDEELVKKYNSAADILRVDLDLNLPKYQKNIQKQKFHIGLLSADFKKSSAYSFMAGYFALAEISEVELFIISNTAKFDAVTRDIKCKHGHWIDLRQIPEDQHIEVLRNLNLDVVIDMNGFTSGNRVDLLVNRIASKQFSTLGFSYSLGGLVDGLILPSTACPTYNFGIRESIVAMETPLPMSQMKRRKNDTIAQDRIGFQTAMSCSRAVRINEQVISAWSSISKATGCTIRIESKDYQAEDLSPYLLPRHHKHFTDQKKLQVGFTTPVEEALDLADISLDCFPHNSGTTLYDSVTSGVPFVSLRGRQILGYLGAHVASVAELPDYCVVNTVDEYVAAAKKLLDDVDYRREAKFNLPQSLKKNGCNVRQYADELFEKLKVVVELT